MLKLLKAVFLHLESYLLLLFKTIKEFIQMEILGNQAAFLADYKKIVKTGNMSDEMIIDKVVGELPTAPNFQIIADNNETKLGQRICFPFKQEITATDPDGVITTHYIYIGSPFELDTKADEQP